MEAARGIIEAETETMEKAPTRRELQADSTKKRIYDIAIGLMDDRGFTDTTIMDICEKAEVSIGTFYNYFSSKEEIFFDIYKKADDHFKSNVAHSLERSRATAIGKIVLFFRHYARYNQKQGFNRTNQLYNTKNKLFIVKGRYMQELLRSIVVSGKSSGEISSVMDAEEITDFLFIASRGIVYDWCVKEASYDLEARMDEYMARLMSIFAPGSAFAPR
jgi:TetR/AcrR family transcriptional regulator, fatty acid metabolism regulator protein